LKLWHSLDAATRRNLAILFAASLLFWVSLSSLLPTLPLYVQSLGANKQQVGMVMAWFAAGLLLFRPGLARMADRRGRWLVLIIGLAVVAIAPMLYPLTRSFEVLMAIRAFHGLSIAAFTTASSALVVDLSPPQQRGELLGYMSLANPLGMALGPAMGSFIQADWGNGWLFGISAVLGGLGTLCALALRVPDSTLPSGTALPEDPLWRLLIGPRLRVPTLLMLAVGLVFGCMSIFVPLMIQQSGVDLKAGLFYTAAAITSFAVRFPTGPLSDRMGRGLFISLSLVIYGVSMLMLSRAQTAEMFLAAGLVEGLAGGTFIPMVIALIADRSGPHERARMLGLCVGGFDLGLALAGPCLGAVADQLGYRGLFEAAAAIAGVGLVIFLGFSSQTLGRSLRFALSGGRDLYAWKAPVSGPGL
jgi:MFS family permease